MSPLPRVATSLYTYTAGGRVHTLPVLHYGHEPVFIRGYVGGVHSLGDTLRALLSRPSRDLDAP